MGTRSEDVKSYFFIVLHVSVNTRDLDLGVPETRRRRGLVKEQHKISPRFEIGDKYAGALQYKRGRAKKKKKKRKPLLRIEPSREMARKTGYIHQNTATILSQES